MGVHQRKQMILKGFLQFCENPCLGLGLELGLKSEDDGYLVNLGPYIPIVVKI